MHNFSLLSYTHIYSYSGITWLKLKATNLAMNEREIINFLFSIAS